MTVGLQLGGDQLLPKLPTVLGGDRYADTPNHDRHAIAFSLHLGPA